MSPPLLELRRLRRDYPAPGGRNPLRALDDVSFCMEAGTIFGIVGESGSGKSTMARLVMALDRPTSGAVLFEGQDLAALGARELARRRGGFQMIFQDPYGSLDPRQSVERIVGEPLFLLEPSPRRQARRDRVAQALEEVGLEASDLRRYPHEFSGGQRQRIAIARALITRPKLVVADEAVSALDLTTQAQILRLILGLRDRHGLSVLFITHDLGVVDEIADRVGVMRHGRLLECGPTRDVLDRPAHDYTRRLIEAELTLGDIGRFRRSRSPTSP